MRLSEVLRGVDVNGSFNDCEVSGICVDSRLVEEGNIFVCIKGLKTDSHDLITDEIEKKASAIITEKDLGRKNQIITGDTRKALALIASNFYGNKKNKLKIIAATGTNGKTTVTTLIKQVLDNIGVKAGLIGTVKYELGDYSLSARYTTPDPIELHRLFDKMERMGVEYVVMEASSHSLEQLRLYGIQFDIGLWTNLTRDHLDFHGTMENYYLAKKKLFDNSKCAIVNVDDEYGARLYDELKAEGKNVKSFSLSDITADYSSTNIRTSERGVSFELVTLGNIGRITLPTPGEFSVANGILAASALMEAGFPLSKITESLLQSSGVKGRSEIIPTGRDFTVMCDYAHTPDSLEKIFSSTRQFAKGRIVALFGAAGKRDSEKRAEMGYAAAKYADFVIITSDNPRDEDPFIIASQVEEGVKRAGKPYIIILDRYDAIFYAIKNARTGDIIVLAGKGHEDYQVLDGYSVYFDEREIVKQALKQYYGN